MSEKTNIPKSHGRFDTAEDGEEFVNIEEKHDQIQDKKQDEEKTMKEKKEQANQVARQNLE
ncbi:hypothetical protein ACWV26_12375 [Rummeliibacillus sp. JY-2-4R]